VGAEEEEEEDEDGGAGVVGEGAPRRRQRAGRVGDVGWFAKARVWERSSGVAWTEDSSCS
jgi:hypothetical protein